MSTETCLLNYFIRNNDVVSSCDFIPEKLSGGKVIYEVIRVIDGIPLFYKEHSLRFFNSLKYSNINPEFTGKQLSGRIVALIEYNKLVDGNIKFQISIDSNNQQVFSAWVCPFYYPNMQLYKTGVVTQTVELQREHPNVKIHNNDLVSRISKILASTGCYEVILVNKNGMITEGSKSNIFFVNNDSIVTPRLEDVLPGVTRNEIFEASVLSNIVCLEENIKLSSISKFQGVFLTGTSPKVLPIAAIDGIEFNPKHSVIKHIMIAYDRLVQNNISSFSWDE